MTQQVMSNSPVAFSTNQSFLVALLAAVIVHIVFMVGVQVPQPEARKINKDIDITLVDTPTQKAPEQTQFLAPENQLAQGQQTSKPEPAKPIAVPKEPAPEIKPTPKPPVEKPKPVAQNKPIIKTPPPPAKVAPQEKRMIKTPPEQAKTKLEEKRIIKTPSEQAKTEPVKKLEPIKPAPEIKPVITAPERNHPMIREMPIPKDLFQETGKPEEVVEPQEQVVQKTKQKTEPHNTNIKHIPLSTATLQQQISETAVASTQQPASATQTKTKRVNQVSANKSVAAQYKRDWESKVERVGNLNYPEAATKPGFSATLTMDVGIKTDGSIDSMRITQSSGIPELDEAAKKIVEMSAPFPPLPAALRSELDILLITRVWKFTDESGLIAQ